MFEKYSHIHTQLPYLPHLLLLTSFVAGIAVCLMISAVITKTEAGKECSIEYISRDEILAFEKARVKRMNEQKLFFGKTREAIKAIEKLTKQRANAGSHIIYTKGNFVRGKGVSSISARVHAEVIQILRKEAKERMQDNDTQDYENQGRISEDRVSEEGGIEDRGIEGKNTNSPALKILQQLEKEEEW